MKAEFNYKLDVKIVHNISDLNELVDLKSPTEMVTDLIGLIADECAMCGGVRK